MSVVNRGGTRKGAFKLRAKVAGTAEVAAALAGVKQGVRNRVLKAAGAKQARKAVRVEKAALVAKRTGQLAKALGSVYRKYAKGDRWVYVAGPRHGFGARVKVLKKAQQAGAIRKARKGLGRKLTAAERTRVLEQYIDPAKYAHLVEGGRKVVRPFIKGRPMSDGVNVWGTVAAHVAPRPFVRPAAEAVAGGVREFAADCLEGIEREVRKYARKGKSVRG